MTVARPLFHVKICGVTTAADAALAAEAGADAIGINFVAGSPRCVDAMTARAVAAAVPPGMLVVGVFAGMPAARIGEIVSTVGLGAVQFHGHLSGTAANVDLPEACAAVRAATGSLPVIRAVGFGAAGLEEARRWIAAARPAMAIVDAAPRGAALGGTGTRIDWSALARELPLGVPWALAGGLDPTNVAEAIGATRAAAVDVASGVESTPGRKDPERVRAFVSAARTALERGPVRPARGG